MSLSCLFGHKWDGCKCEKCGKIRNEGHRFETYYPMHTITPGGAENRCVSTCSICKKIRESIPHDYINDPNKCYQECRRCGYKTEAKHVWEQVPGACMEKCAVCGETRALMHSWKELNGKVRCSRCGETNPDAFMDDCVEKLLAIFPDSAMDYQAHQKFDAAHRAEIREIGTQLDALGGMRAMRRVGEAFAARKPIHARKLETTWDGIGNWLG